MLLKKGANVNAETINGETPLTLAIDNGHAAMIELLKANGAKVNNVIKVFCLDTLFYLILFIIFQRAKKKEKKKKKKSMKMTTTKIR